MTSVLAALLGLIAGPFVRLAIDHVSAGSSDPRSRQPVARSGWRYVRPVLSWSSTSTPGVAVAVGSPVEGQVRTVRVAQWRAPAIDLVTAVTFAALVAAFEVAAMWPALFVFGAASIALSVVDIDDHRLPDRLVFPAVLLCGALLTTASIVEDVPGAVVAAALGAVAYSGFLFVLFLVSPAGLGLGDVKLALLLGLMLGWTGAIELVDGILEAASLVDALSVVLAGALAGTVIGALVGQGVRLTRGHNGPLPLGPSLCLGALLVMLISGPAWA